MDDIRPPELSKKLSPERLPTSGQSPQPLLQPPPLQPDLPAPDQRLLPPPHSKKRLKWWLLGIFLALLGIITILAGIGYIWYQDALKAPSAESNTARVIIEPGSTAEQVTADLQTKGLIKHSLAALIYMRLHRKTEIKAGTYLLAPNQSLAEIIQWITEGRIDTFRLTILPGQTIAQIKESLQEYGYGAAEIEAAFAKQHQNTIFAGKPANAGLEGYIYPETYFINSDMTVEQVLAVTFDEFAEQLQQHQLISALQERGFTLWQGVILASIIEKEVAGDQDRRQVAQVFEKRLKEGISLGSDPTYKYAATLLGIPPTIDLDSPYNTRIHTGLPPGPIGNFTLSALQAVAHPAPGDYLYFVAGDDGKNYFSHTLQEHEENIRLHCAELCAQP